MKTNLNFLLGLLILIGTLAHCTKEPTEKLTSPTINTKEANNIGNEYAYLGGLVTSNPPSLHVLESGVYIGTQESPEKSGIKIPFRENGAPPYYSGSISNFVMLVGNLLPNTTYYVKAYASNTVGLGYGNQVSFTTNAKLSAVSTIQVTEVTSSSAKSGGRITYDGGASVTARGVCWSISPNPLISNNKTTDGQGVGEFVSTITNLQPNTKYYLRAYATNAAGTQYGEELIFQTISNTVPTLTTTNYKTISSTSARLGGQISNNTNETIIEKGVYIGTQSKPETTGKKVAFNNSQDSFMEDVSGLSPSTTYFVKAYAKNNVGIGLGQELTFTTEAKDYVEVGSVKWSMYNVNSPRTFTSSQYDYGMYYQWSRAVGWSYEGNGQYFDMGPAYSSPSGKSWKYDYDYTITEWEEIENPCPYSYRLPTFPEYQQMLSYVKEYGWYTLTNDKSKLFIRFTFNNNSVLYFPGAGYRGTDGSAEGKTNSSAHYWASNSNNALVIKNKDLYNNRYTGIQALLVRCVKK